MLLIDEMSMGLAPLIVERLLEAVGTIARGHGCAVVLVEQHVSLALGVADDAAVLNQVSIVLQDAAAALVAAHDRLEEAYLGISTSAAAPGS